MTTMDQQLPTGAFASFDNTITRLDDEGNRVCYLIDPLAVKYIVPPGSTVLDGMLPPQDMEVRRALVEMKVATEQLAAVGFLSRLFGSQAYRNVLHTSSRRWQRTALMKEP